MWQGGGSLTENSLIRMRAPPAVFTHLRIHTKSSYYAFPHESYWFISTTNTHVNFPPSIGRVCYVNRIRNLNIARVRGRGVRPVPSFCVWVCLPLYLNILNHILILYSFYFWETWADCIVILLYCIWGIIRDRCVRSLDDISTQMKLKKLYGTRRKKDNYAVR